MLLLSGKVYPHHVSMVACILGMHLTRHALDINRALLMPLSIKAVHCYCEVVESACLRQHLMFTRDR